MFKKNRFLISCLFSVAFIFMSCQQPEKQVTDNIITNRIPVSVKDSLLLSIDKSPMDMIYFPDDYPKQKMVTPDMANPLARVIYSRPQKNKRIIFADSSVTQNVIQHYGQDWRLGANEATEIEFFRPAVINGKKYAAGRYILYCIPSPATWKIFFNTNLYSWGLHIDKSKDIGSIELPVTKNNIETEYFTMLFRGDEKNCNLEMAWGDMKVELPISFE